MYRFIARERHLIWGTETWMIPDIERAEDYPLLIKFIAPHRDLSIQVHPDDSYARSQGAPSGKTELWYVTDAAPGAYLYSGLRESLSPEQYAARVADGSIAEALAKYYPKQGDCFFIPPGRIHSLGAGTQVCEIQQNADITYRIFDYNRLDAEGNPRPLHTRQASECIDYTVLPDYQSHYTGEQLVACSYFTANILEVTSPRRIPVRTEARPHAIIILTGEHAGSVLGLEPGDALILTERCKAIEVYC